MNLLEILNTTVSVDWQKHEGFRNVGSFYLNGDKYSVDIDEYAVLGKTLVDVGFSTNSSIMAKNSSAPAAVVLGAVGNAIVEKLKTIHFDVVLISVMNSTGLVDSRKRVYDSLTRILGRQLGIVYDSGWMNTSYGSVKLWSKTQLTDEESKLLLKQAVK